MLDKKPWLTVLTMIFTKGVLLRSGLCYVLLHQTFSSMSLLALPCALQPSHVGWGRCQLQTVKYLLASAKSWFIYWIARQRPLIYRSRENVIATLEFSRDMPYTAASNTLLMPRLYASLLPLLHEAFCCSLCRSCWLYRKFATFVQHLLNLLYYFTLLTTLALLLSFPMSSSLLWCHSELWYHNTEI